MSRPDRPSLTASFQAHYEDLLRFLTRRTGNPQWAADIAQDTYVRLAGAQDQIATVDDPRAYVFRVAGNLAIDSLRKEARHSAWVAGAGDGEGVADPAPLAESTLLARERLALVDQALEQLPPKARRALLLARVEGRSFAEIAAELGVSESMVAKYIAQALRVCRDHLRQRDA